MELIQTLLDWLLHLDKHLGELISQYGVWTYAILFLIIFIETGLVIMPILPGDSLLFAAGMFASIGNLNIALLIVLLIAAAIIGDTLNYHIGKFIGPKVFSIKSRWIKQEHLIKAQSFYEKHGAKTIIIARFVPIVRTFAPFVAGIGTMQYRKFIVYNIVGAVVWVVSLTLLGYFLAENELVRKHFEKVVLAIIFISVFPILLEYFKNKKTNH
jgi:membrane-associated protein